MIAAQEPGGYLGITSPGIRTAARPSMSASLLGRVHINPAETSAGLTPVATPQGALGPAYEVRLRTVTAVECTVPMVPFANVGQWYRSAEERQDPAPVDHAYSVRVASAQPSP